jgi:hypothetical protein
MVVAESPEEAFELGEESTWGIVSRAMARSLLDFKK